MKLETQNIKLSSKLMEVLTSYTDEKLVYADEVTKDLEENIKSLGVKIVDIWECKTGNWFHIKNESDVIDLIKNHKVKEVFKKTELIRQSLYRKMPDEQYYEYNRLVEDLLDESKASEVIYTLSIGNGSYATYKAYGDFKVLERLEKWYENNIESNKNKRNKGWIQKKEKAKEKGGRTYEIKESDKNCEGKCGLWK